MTVVPRVAMTLTQVSHRVPGGTATSLGHLAAALSRSGRVDLTAVLARGDLRRPSSMLRPEQDAAVLLDAGVRSATMDLPLPLLYDTWARAGRPTLRSAVGPIDLVHVTLPLKVGIGDTPMVATVHDVFPLSRSHEFTARGARLMRDGLRWVLGNARVVMVPSATVRAAVVDQGVPEDRTLVVPWGVVCEPAGASQIVEVRRRLGLSGPYLLFVGTLEPRKNLRGLMEAVARLDRPDLTLAVVGPTGWGDVLAGLATPASPVARLGHVSETDLSALYAGAAAFCYPSFEEGFGLPVLEAMAAGTPVVTSSGTATEDAAGGAALLVDPADPGAIAAALASVLDDVDLAARLRAAGLEQARSHSWSDAADLALIAYRTALGA
ncbi:MAG: glycosyltransferase family 1 protein [Microthrixaceae bacterium]